MNRVFLKKRRKAHLGKLQVHWKKLVKWGLDLLYPPRCAICDEILGKKERGCCAVCERKLPWVSGPVCFRCGKPVKSREQEYCFDCSRFPHVFDRGCAAFTYTGGMRRSVYRMKAENRREYLDFYAEAMAESVMHHLEAWKPERILPVPMYPAKKRRRGYNQSELLAERLAERTGILSDASLLRCVRPHAEQKELTAAERRRNLTGCFSMEQGGRRYLPSGMRRSRPDLLPRSVLLVDDVYTTGSTMDALAEVLKSSGVQKVYFVVLCSGKGK